MKKYLFLIMPAILFLSGCATYSFRKGESPYDQGYVAARYDRVIPEYTLGKDNSVPSEEELARERFKRRRKTVENYYKKMGYIENRFKQNFIDPPIFILKTIFGIFRMPFIAVSDYRYNHNPKYKEEVDKREDAEYKAERERLKGLKDRLAAYVQEDLQEETQGTAKTQEKVKKPVKAKKPARKKPLKEKPEGAAREIPPQAKEGVAPVTTPEVASVKTEEPVTSKAAVEPPRLDPPEAVIIAKPTKGVSPLRVQFSAAKSSSPNGRIVAYGWDFGDGDTSGLKNPVNTYWSVTYGTRNFTATLKVTDEKGMTAETTAAIEVATK